MTIADRVKKIIADLLGLRTDEIKDDATWADLGADSLDTVEAVLDIEVEFGILVPDAAAETWLTVGDAITYVEKAIG
jgi:acyl carrier protein